MRFLPRLFPLALVLASPLGAQSVFQEDEHEEMHGGVGFCLPVGSMGSRLDPGWTLTFGGVYWLAPRTGIHGELGFSRIGLSQPLLRDLGSPRDGIADFQSVVAGICHRLHAPEDSGFFLVAGGGIFNRQLSFDSPSSEALPADEPWTGAQAGQPLSSPMTSTRPGWNLGLGWERPLGRGAFFVEVRWQRIFTRGQATDLVPLIVGSRF